MKKAFTLVEILIIFCILALLLAILMPAFLRVVKHFNQPQKIVENIESKDPNVVQRIEKIKRLKQNYLIFDPNKIDSSYVEINNIKYNIDFFYDDRVMFVSDKNITLSCKLKSGKVRVYFKEEEINEPDLVNNSQVIFDSLLDRFLEIQEKELFKEKISEEKQISIGEQEKFKALVEHKLMILENEPNIAIKTITP
ncbi:MAG: hypothetical protein ACP5OG_03065 [Candidatus Nanoarchaeia archaeon]